MNCSFNIRPYENVSLDGNSSVRIAGDLGGVTLLPGIYQATGFVLIKEGDLTLDGQGNEQAVWIFEIANDLTTVGGAGGNVILSGGGEPKNVFWKIGQHAILGEDTFFKGNIVSRMMHEEMNVTSTVAEALSVKFNATQIPFNRRESMAASL